MKISNKKNYILYLYKFSSLGNTIGFLDKEDISTVHISKICKQYQLDQLMSLRSPVKIWNADGSSAKACGNGTRCLIAHILMHYEKPKYQEFWHKRGFVKKNNILKFEGPVGTLEGFLPSDSPLFVFNETFIFVRQGQVLLERDGSLTFQDLLDKTKNSSWEKAFYSFSPDIQKIFMSLNYFTTSIGNLHLIIPINEDILYKDILASFLEKCPLFMDGINVSFLNIEKMLLTTWERGVGWTLGCASALCCGAFILDFLDKTHKNIEKSYKIKTPGGESIVYIDNNIFTHGASVLYFFKRNIKHIFQD